jgi:putative toxin-antitoxin system antitoxin component (TIGR02293 family)
LYAATPLDRVTIIRQGVPAAEVVEISEGMGVGKERVYSILGLPRATVVRKIKNNEALSPEQSERVIGLERLIGQVATMVVESGDPTGFDAGQWVGEWLECPLAALGGAKPGDFMDTMEGQEIVSKLLAQAQSGAYS